MKKFFKQISSEFYKIRALFWEYPDILIFAEDSFFQIVSQIYRSLRPVSHILSSIFIYALIGIVVSQYSYALVNSRGDSYIEGAIVGVDDNGDLLGIKRINPLIPTNIQLEKDISNIIYESLFRLSPDGSGEYGISEYVLLEDNGIEKVKDYNHYKFRLRQGVKWHDGKELTTEDVKATFELLIRLDKSINTASKFTNVISSQFEDIIISSKYEFELKLKPIGVENPDTGNVTTYQDAVLPTFFESIAFKIMPSEYIKNLDTFSILSTETDINVFPIGTGPYEFVSSDKDKLRLERNEDYYKGVPSIKNLTFKLFQDEESAIYDVQTSRIHGLTGVSTENIERLENMRNYELYRSNVIYNQYWALFINLNAESGNKLLQDEKIRQAIDLSINREEILKEIANLGEEAYGTIPKISPYFLDSLLENTYNVEEANKILDEAGWVIDDEIGYRKKDGKKLAMELIVVDNIDRKKVAAVIKENLKTIGIDLEIIPEGIQTIRDKYLMPRTKYYDILLYGQSTFIDPDRYELFHSISEESTDVISSLNITHYRSSIEGREIDVEQKELIKVPKIDQLLDEGVSMIDIEKRKERYNEVQKILAKDNPVIYLYHPKYSYIVSSRVKNISFENVNNLEDRFDSIYLWKIRN